jgi:hypothetical protein
VYGSWLQNHTFTAKATDKDGAATTTAPLRISVNSLPVPGGGDGSVFGGVELQNPSTSPGTLGPSAPLGTDRLDPSVSRFGFVSNCLEVASRAIAVDDHAGQGRRRRAAPGARLRFTLSESAEARILIERVRPGRQVGKRCKPLTRRLRQRRPCTRFQRAGTITRRDRPGGRNGKPATAEHLRRGRPRPRSPTTGLKVAAAVGDELVSELVPAPRLSLEATIRRHEVADGPEVVEVRSDPGGR